MNNKTKNLNKIIQTLVIFIIAVILFYFSTTLISLWKQPTNVFLLEKSSLNAEEETEGLIIRDEQIVKGEHSSNGMLQIKTEGEKVAKNEAIFRYYSENEETIKQKISEVETKIEDNIVNTDDVISSEIPLLEEQMKQELVNLYDLSDLQKIRTIKGEINNEITKKIEIIGEATTNTQIKELIKQKKSYENELSKNSEYLNAPTSGVVSYRVDNYEDILNAGDFSYVTKEFIDKIDIKTGQIIGTSDESGKIIDNFESYIAVCLNSDAAKNARIGDKQKIRLPNYDEINAEIIYINVEEDNSRTIVFKITNKIEKLIKYRKIFMTIIWWEFNGYKVPNSAIISENNKSYIVRNRNGYRDKILIKIEKQNDSYTIIDNYTTDELKELGYSKDEIDKIPQLSLYDEIVINN